MPERWGNVGRGGVGLLCATVAQSFPDELRGTALLRKITSISRGYSVIRPVLCRAVTYSHHEGLQPTMMHPIVTTQDNFRPQSDSNSRWGASTQRTLQ